MSCGIEEGAGGAEVYVAVVRASRQSRWNSAPSMRPLRSTSYGGGGGGDWMVVVVVVVIVFRQRLTALSNELFSEFECLCSKFVSTVHFNMTTHIL